MRAKERRPCLAIRRLVNARWDRREEEKWEGPAVHDRARMKRGSDESDGQPSGEAATFVYYYGDCPDEAEQAAATGDTPPPQLLAPPGYG